MGRLATFRYDNMDQTVGRAVATFDRIDAALPRVFKPVGGFGSLGRPARPRTRGRSRSRPVTPERRAGHCHSYGRRRTTMSSERCSAGVPAVAAKPGSITWPFTNEAPENERAAATAARSIPRTVNPARLPMRVGREPTGRSSSCRDTRHQAARRPACRCRVPRQDGERVRHTIVDLCPSSKARQP